MEEEEAEGIRRRRKKEKRNSSARIYRFKTINGGTETPAIHDGQAVEVSFLGKRKRRTMMEKRREMIANRVIRDEEKEEMNREIQQSSAEENGFI
ncbi:predicted protein [Arabidopsis lyrata subsp. lyrata]|uniref:Predicted protein n=1 Tax=Arabidopsis lyrata subsp. lyrata TaxID=81972 RepID=D7KZC0_ARALL|nr:predicted protein [Arabidopsis lyrata subsp. lyrata]